MSMDLDDSFDDYMRKVNPMVRRDSVQYRESRRCFFAGAFKIFAYTQKVAFELSEDKAVEELQNLDKQFMEFKDRVGEDKD